MNKRAEIEWLAVITLILCLLFISLIVIGVYSTVQSQNEKFENLCKKRGMEYFDFNHPIGTKGIVICLDNQGIQHEVDLK